MTLVVHPHLHPRRTGVTTHTEAIVPALAAHLEARVYGRALGEALPRITLGEVLRRAKTEAVVWHAHRNNELLLGHALKALRPTLRLVYTRHGSTRPSGLTQALAASADGLVALNAEAATQLGGRARVVPHGVDLARLHPPLGPREAAWAALGQGGRHGLGVIGRLRPDKGQGEFVEAIAPLLPLRPDWRAVLVGAALGRHAAWADALRARGGPGLCLVGEQRDIARWYQGLTVLVSASHAESFGLTLVEGMAAGCCVVSTRLPHVPALIEHGRTGFLFETGDVAGLRGLLAELLAHPERAEAVGRAAAEEARARFSIAREAEALAGLYAQVVAAP